MDNPQTEPVKEDLQNIINQEIMRLLEETRKLEKAKGWAERMTRKEWELFEKTGILPERVKQ